MPRVPQSNVTPMLPPQKGGAEAPSPTMLAMAAALMQAEGKVDTGDYATNTLYDSLFSGRSAAQNRFIEATRKYPFRLGLGPAAPESFLAGERAAGMNDAQRIEDRFFGGRK